MGKRNHMAPTKWTQIVDPGQDPNEVRNAMYAKYKQQKRVVNRLDLEAGLFAFEDERAEAAAEAKETWRELMGDLGGLVFGDDIWGFVRDSVPVLFLDGTMAE